MRAVFLAIISKFPNNRKRMLLTVVSLTLGVALLVSLQIAIKTTKDKFGQVINSEISNADIFIKNISSEVITDNLDFVNNIDNVKLSLPRVEVKGIAKKDNSDFYVTVIGVKLQQEIDTRSFELENGQLPNNDRVLIPKSISEKYNLRIGDKIQVNISYGTKVYTISGITKMQGITSSSNGNVIVVPIDNLKEYMHVKGVTSLNIILKDITKRDETINKIKNNLSPSSEIQIPQGKNNYYIKTLKGFFLGLNIFSLISVLAGGFIIYNTISKFVAEQKQEIAILKVLGTTTNRIILYVLIQALLYSVISIVLGIALGISISGIITGLVMQSAVGASISTFGSIEITTLIKDVVFVLIVSVVSSILPAVKAARITIIEGLTISKKNSQYSKRVIYVLFILATTFLLYTVIFQKSKDLFVYSLIIGIICFTYIGLYIVIGPITNFINKYLFPKKFMYAGNITKNNINNNIPRTVNTIFTCGLCLALAVTILGVSNGFQNSLDEWMDSMYQGDIMTYCRLGIGEDVLTKLSKENEVDKVIPNYSNELFDNKSELKIDVESISGYELNSKLFQKHISATNVISEDKFSSDNQIIISSLLAKELNKTIGDFYYLETESGKIKVEIVGIMDSFLSEEYKIYIPLNNFIRFYPSKKLTLATIYLKPNIGSKEFIKKSSLNYDKSVEFTLMKDEINSKKNDISQSLFTTFYVLVVVSLLISGLCLVNSMNMNVMESEYQFGILKCLGMPKKLLRSIVYSQGMLLGVYCVIIGSCLGIAIQYVSVRLTEIVTGWKIQFVLSTTSIGLVCAVGIFISIISSIYPALSSYKVNVVYAIRRGDI